MPGPPAEAREAAGEPRAEPTLAERELAERVAWMVSLRWLAAAGLVAGGVAALYFLHGPSDLRRLLPAVVGLGALVALYNACLLAAWRRPRPGHEGLEHPRAVAFAHLQIALDLAALTGFVALTGGYASPFLGLYVLHMVLASILLSQRAAYGWAAAGTVLGAGLILLSGPPETFRFAPEGVSVAGFKLLLVGGFASLLHASVYLAASIVARLRARQEEAQQLLLEVRRQTALLADAYERLQATQHMQTAYMRRVSHELRSPLAAITTSLEVVRDGYAGPVPDAAREAVSRAHERIAQLLRMVDDLLALSRAHAGAAREQLERVSMAVVVEEVLRLLAERAERRRIGLVNETSSDLPAILADREEMVQLVTNLTANAIKYSHEGTTVRVGLAAEGRSLVLHVRDEGIGIPPEDLPHIFEEFFRSKRGRLHAAVGTGLGLSIVRTIAEHHGGEVSVASTLGAGTTFSVRLPVDGPAVPGADRPGRPG